MLRPRGAPCRLVVWSVLSCLILLPSHLFAAAKPVTPKPPPTLTITKLDGLSVKGQFISADPRQVTLALLIKPGVFGEHVTTPWKEIKQVSNGLTH